MSRFTLLMLIGSLCAAQAQVFRPVPDIAFPETTLNSDVPMTHVTMNGILYFIWNDGVHGNEVWRSDGSEAGTFMIKDLITHQNQEITSLSVLADRLTIILQDRLNPSAKSIYASDGSRSGTQKMHEVETLGMVHVIGEMTYFSANGATYRIGLNESEPTQLAASDSALFASPTLLFWSDPVAGIYATDGQTSWLTGLTSLPNKALGDTLIFTNDGLAMADTDGSNYRVLRDHNVVLDITRFGQSYFFIEQGPTDKTCWLSEGTYETTQMLNADYPWAYSIYESELFAAPGGALLRPNGWYFTDGSVAGSSRLNDLGSEVVSQTFLTSNSNHSFFQGRNRETGLFHILKLVGKELTHFHTSRDAIAGRVYAPLEHGALINQVGVLSFLDAHNDTHQVFETQLGKAELHQAQTATGTFLASPNHGVWFFKTHSITKISDDFKSQIVSDGVHAYFITENNDVWQSDGTPAGTQNLGIKAQKLGGFPGQFVAIDAGRIFMAGQTNSDENGLNDYVADQLLYHNGNLYSYNGHNTVTATMNVYRPGSPIETIHLPTPFTNDPIKIGALYIDPFGTIFDPINQSSRNPYPAMSFVVQAKERTFYISNSPTSGTSLYATNGLTETVLLENHPTAPEITNTIADLDGELYFAGRLETTGTELYRLNQGEPVLVADINPGPESSEITNLTVYGSKLYFSAYHPDYGYELWSSDGTSQGTQRLTDISINDDSAFPRNLFTSAQGLFFEAIEDGTYKQFWLGELDASIHIQTDICSAGEAQATAIEDLPGLSYTWSLEGGVLLSGQNSGAIQFSANPGSDQVEVNLTVTYGTQHASSSITIPVTNNPPATPGTITGPTESCTGSKALTYEVPAVSDAYRYEWQLPAGAAIVEGHDSRAITVDFGDQAGDVRVRAHNACGSSAWQSLNVALTSDFIAYAGSDRVSCETSLLLAANQVAGTLGQWHILQGSGATLTDPNLATTSFQGIEGETYLLEWRLSHPTCGESADTVRIHFEYGVPQADAGEDINHCGNTVTLDANLPETAFGVWQVLSGSGGQFLDPLDPKTQFNGKPEQTYSLAWTLYAKPCGDSMDTVEVTLNNDLIAEAGPEHVIAHNDFAQLCANGVGQWSVLSGPELSPTQFDDPANPYAAFRPAGGPGTYQLEWQLSTSDCPSSSATTQVRAMARVPNPILVSHYGLPEPDILSQVKILASARQGDALYYSSDAFPYGIHKEMHGEHTYLGALSEVPENSMEIYPVGEDLLILGEYTYWYQAAKNRLEIAADLPISLGDKVVIYNNQIYFEQQGNVSSSKDIWVSDGTLANTRRLIADASLLDIWQGQLLFFSQGQIFAGNGEASSSYSMTPGASYPSVVYLGGNSNTISFAVPNATNWSILATEGSGAEARHLHSVDAAGLKGLAVLGEVILYATKTDDVYGHLWRTDGQPATTQVLSSMVHRNKIYTINNQLYYNNSADYQSWRSDGTVLGTYPYFHRLVQGIAPLDDAVYVSSLGSIYRLEGHNAIPVVDDGVLNILGYSKTHILLSDNNFIKRTAAFEAPSEVVLAPRDEFLLTGTNAHSSGNLASFYYSRHLSNQALHVTDGTQAGSRPLLEIADNEYIDSSYNNGDKILFRTLKINDASSPKLYSSDGTQENTRFIGEFPTPASTFQFEAHDGGYLVGALWTGLHFFKNENRTRISQNAVHEFKKDPYSNAYYYLSWDGGLELWRSDGSPEGTQLLRPMPSNRYLTSFALHLTSSHIFAYSSSTAVIVTRADLSIQEIDLDPELFDSKPVAHQLGDLLVFASRSEGLATLDHNGTITPLGSPAGRYANLVPMGESLVTVDENAFYIITTDALVRHDRIVQNDPPPRLYSMGDGVLFWNYTRDRGIEGYYFDEAGPRPLPELIPGPNYKNIQATLGLQNQAYIFTNDDHGLSSIYKLAVDGPSFADRNLYDLLLSHYDLNEDGFLSWEEAALITILDLSGGAGKTIGQGYGITNLTGIEALENLSHLIIAGNPIEDLSPVVAAGLGSSPGDIIDLERALLGDAACADLARLQARVNQSGAGLTYSLQGGVIEDLNPEEWPQKTILGLISESIPPLYEWQCPDNLSQQTETMAPGEVQ